MGNAASLPMGIAASLRLGVAALVFGAVGTTWADALGRGPVNPLNFFGYFTVQSNLLLAAVFVWAAVAARLPRHADGEGLGLARSFTTTYIAVVGLVYALLLAPLGQAGGVPVPWANVVLHIVTPVYAVVDWLVLPPPHRLAWTRLWAVLLYPAGWLVVVLARGATDGWVPYPFLDPAQGCGVIAAVAAGIAATTLALGAAVFLAGRSRGANIAPIA